jgi:TM2 domain-containing membrane protein YozV
VAQVTQVVEISPKSRIAAALLAWFLGTLGIHRFYIGKVGTGIAILVLSIVGWATTWLLGFGYILLTIAGLWVFIDFILIILGAMKDSQNRPIKTW